MTSSFLVPLGPLRFAWLHHADVEAFSFSITRLESILRSGISLFCIIFIVLGYVLGLSSLLDLYLTIARRSFGTAFRAPLPSQPS